MAIEAISGAAAYTAPSTSTSAGTGTVAVPAAASVETAASTESSAKVTVKSEGTGNQEVNLLGQTDAPITEDKMKKAINDINRSLQDKTCEFGYDEVTNRVTIKIIDKETDEVIRELPPEKTLKMIAKAWELAGILVDEKL